MQTVRNTALWLGCLVLAQGASQPAHAQDRTPTAPATPPVVQEALPSGAPAAEPPPLPDMPGLPPADDIPPLPDMPGLPPADDIPPLPDMPGLPPANDIPAGDAAGASKKPKKSEDDAGETVVRVRRRPRAATSTRASAQEAKRLPGTQGDALRVIESLPGVGRASFNSGDLLLWGASPDSSKIYIDGVPIPRLFHGGGLRSVLNGFFVKDLELLPGAYGADYGGASAGMVRITTAPLQEKQHGVVQVDVLDSSAAASTQVGKRLFVAGGFRYSYMSKLAPLAFSKEALQYTIIPQYSDYQGRVEYRLSESSRVSLMYMGSTDRGSANFTSDDPARARSSRRDNDFHRITLNYTAQTGDGATAQLMAYFGIDDTKRADQVGPFPFQLKNHATVYGLRASYTTSVSSYTRLYAGVAVDGSFNNLDRFGSQTRPPREGDPYTFGQAPAGDLSADKWKVTQLSVAPFIELPTQLFNKRLDVTPGLYVAGLLNNVSQATPQIADTPTHGLARALSYVEPRLMTNYRFTDKLSAKVGGGIYHSLPNPNDLSAVFGTPGLRSPRSTQGIAGLSYELPWNLSFEAVAFARRIERYVSRNIDPTTPVGHILTQDGKARAYGGQFLLRRRFAHGFTGWMSYTLTHSEVRYHASSSWVPSDFEQRHLFTGVASYDLGLGFTVGSRLRIITGLPRTPVVGRVYDTLNADYQPLFGSYNSVRLQTIYAWDVRIDKTWKFGDAKLIVFIDALNILNRAPAEELIYDPTYTKHAYLRGLPVVADIGIRGEL